MELEDTIEMLHLFNDFYKDKRVLVTGHAGFKGSWLSFLLHLMGAKVAGYSLLPNSDNKMFSILNIANIIDTSTIADIRDEKKLKEVFESFQPEIVIHMAAQALVRPSYSEPIETYTSNVIGTLYVLEAARKTKSVKTFINITTDKCYENKELDYRYKEDDPFGGYDMYSSSKACAEILTSSYRRSFLENHNDSFALASVRAGNVIGGGDWAQDRLLPDCAHSFSKSENVCIRNPIATRPWQHVLEPLFGYLLLACKLSENPQKYATAYNFGPKVSSNLKVAEVAKLAADFWNSVAKHKNAKVTVVDGDGLHEAGLLQLDITKVKNELGFMPVWDAQKAIAKTMDWYVHFYENDTDMIEYTKEQIFEYIQDASKLNTAWACKIKKS